MTRTLSAVTTHNRLIISWWKSDIAVTVFSPLLNNLPVAIACSARTVFSRDIRAYTIGIFVSQMCVCMSLCIKKVNFYTNTTSRVVLMLNVVVYVCRIPYHLQILPVAKTQRKSLRKRRRTESKPLPSSCCKRDSKVYNIRCTFVQCCGFERY